MNISKKQLILWVVSAILIICVAGTGIYLYENSITDKAVETSEQKTNTNEITYEGRDGMTALALLQEEATVEMQGEGINAFVTSINGFTADTSDQFWSYSVNGEDATVGAGSYITKDGDIIKWELKSF